MSVVRRSGPIVGPLIGILALGAVSAGLGPGISDGLGPVAWFVGIGVALGAGAILGRAVWSRPWAFGPADWITLVRLSLITTVAALVAGSVAGSLGLRGGLPHPDPARPVLVIMSAVALVLDLVDGLVARATGTASAQGARFDMETDAFLIFVLSLYASVQIGPWVLAIGLMRYAYWLCGFMVPRLTQRVPPRYWRKVVAAIQGITLTVVAAAIFPRVVEITGSAVALLLLVESFGRDIIWQLRRRVITGPRTVTIDR